MGIRLSDDEAWAVIEGSHTGILTTLRADGSPITLPTWFVVLDRAIGLMTPAGTKKHARIAHDPRASFLVESGERWAELRGVHLSGRVEPVEDEAAIERLAGALDAKYRAFRTERTDMPEKTRERYAHRRYYRL